MNTATIYALCDPITGIPHYVGQSIDPERRLKTHRSKARRGSTVRVYVWWRACLSEPRLEVLETDAGPGAEVFWISYLKVLGLRSC